MKKYNNSKTKYIFNSKSPTTCVSMMDCNNISTNIIKAKSMKWVPPFTSIGHVDLFYINNILKAEYGSPNHGNPTEPLDDLIYLILTRKTPIKKGKSAYQKLKRVVNCDWGNLLLLSEKKLNNIIGDLGLVETRLRDIPLIIKEIVTRFGSADLSKMKRWPNKSCIDFLTKLPGVGPKTARCVMLYSLGRKVFPADTHCIRILGRVGLISESLMHNHKKAQEILSKIIPPKYTYDLHVNLISHGQNICTAHSPNCKDCVIYKFCHFYRNNCIKKWNSEKSRPSVIDLFCGAGGTGVGLSQNIMDSEDTLRISLAVDIDRWASKTYWVNHPELPAERVLTADLCNKETVDRIKSLTEDDNIILIIGGPPCQGFSLIGTTGRNSVKPVDGRRFIEIDGNHNYAAFVNSVREIHPRFFVMENVPSILASNGKRARKEIIEDFSDLYNCTIILLDAVKCGAPQKRPRVLIFGVAKHPNNSLSEEALKFIKNYMNKLNETNIKMVTFKQAVSDLPPIESGQGWEFIKYPKRLGRLSNYHKSMRRKQRILFNHVARPNNERDLQLYRLLKPGEIAADAIEKYNRPELMIYRNDVFRDKYKKQRWDKPSTTIVAHLAKDGHMFIHPAQVRSITVREAARIQSFPDNFIFCGPRSEQFKMVGNAVPPLMAVHIRKAILLAYQQFYLE